MTVALFITVIFTCCSFSICFFCFLIILARMAYESGGNTSPQTRMVAMFFIVVLTIP